jgi:hypothetical protein
VLRYDVTADGQRFWVQFCAGGSRGPQLSHRCFELVPMRSTKVMIPRGLLNSRDVFEENRARGPVDVQVSGFAVYQALRLVFVASATNVEWLIDMRTV